MGEAISGLDSFALQFHALLWIAVGAGIARLVSFVLRMPHRLELARAEAHRAWHQRPGTALGRWKDEELGDG